MQQLGYTHETHSDIQRATAPHEYTERATLLDTVTVDSDGIVHCAHSVSGVVMSVAAIQIHPDTHAELLQFEQTNDSIIFRPLGAAARIGFFIGQTSDREVNTVVRIGAYPGRPLVITEEGIHPQEVMTGLHGIKPNEKPELRWAKEVGLYGQLRFHEHSSRGICSSAVQKPNRTWQKVPLCLEGSLPNTYQILGYETEELQRSIDNSTARTCRITLGKLSVKSIQGAFEITAIPQ